MYGTNPIRPPARGDGSTLEVQHIFPTIQGEGPYAGMPAVFIRLGGCNLACSFCDTEFESFRAMRSEEVIESVEKLAHTLETPSPLAGEGWGGGVGKSDPAGMPPSLILPRKGVGNTKLIVITGGEPLRQPIAPLCEALLAKGFKVQIETNGTLWRELPEAVEIICSPKNSGNGYFPLRPDLLKRVNAFKFIVSASRPDYAHVADVGQGDAPVFVQPMDEYDKVKNEANLRLAMELSQNYGYRLSLQLHKIIGVE